MGEHAAAGIPKITDLFLTRLGQKKEDPGPTPGT